MTKRPYGELRDAVIRLADGTRTAHDIAARIGSTSDAVHTLARRYNIRDKLVRQRRPAGRMAQA